MTTKYSCPLAYRCACPVKIRLHEAPSAIALELSGQHTLESLVQDRSKYLTAKMKGVIASKIKENPLKLATDIRTEIATHSPGKQIPVALQASVTHAVRKESLQIALDCMAFVYCP